VDEVRHRRPPGQPFRAPAAQRARSRAAAIRRGLYTLKKVESMAFEEAMSFTESQIALFTLTEDAREGQKAFQEKRKPHWAGR
jgi:1,4-dihydroxy-2-naphthoyl-CoA synthase